MTAASGLLAKVKNGKVPDDAAVQAQLAEIDQIAATLGLTPKWDPIRAAITAVIAAIPAIVGIIEIVQTVTG